jgi:hypothetical protein
MKSMAHGSFISTQERLQSYQGWCHHKSGHRSMKVQMDIIDWMLRIGHANIDQYGVLKQLVDHVWKQMKRTEWLLSASGPTHITSATLFKCLWSGPPLAHYNNQVDRRLTISSWHRWILTVS